MPDQFTGKDQDLDFGGVQYEDNLVSFEWDESVQEAIAEVVGKEYVQGAPGKLSGTAVGSWALAKTDVAFLNAFKPGAAFTSFEHHPGGDTATFIEITSTDVVVTSRRQSVGSNGLYLVTCGFRFNDLTVGTAV